MLLQVITTSAKKAERVPVIMELIMYKKINKAFKRNTHGEKSQREECERE